MTADPTNRRPPAARALLGGGLLLLALLTATEAEARRPGGGQSFSSSSSSSSSSYSSSSSSSSSYSSSSSSYGGSSSSWSSSGSGGGGGGGNPNVDAFFLGVIGLMSLSIPYFGFIGIRDTIRARQLTEELLEQYAGPNPAAERTGLIVADLAPFDPRIAAPSARTARPRPSARRKPRIARGGPRRVGVDRLRRRDPDFSAIVFRDLAYRLYAEAYRAARDRAASEALTPYLSDELRADIASRVHGEVVATLVADLHVVRYQLDDDAFVITADYTSNILMKSRDGGDATIYAVERWEFRRRRDAKTRPPAAVARLGCPSCGAPSRGDDPRRCAHCGEIVDDGRLEWRAVSRTVRTWERQLPTLVQSVAEVGTDAPTRRQRGVERRLQELAADDPAFSLDDLVKRAETIYHAVNAGWNADAPELFRPYVSDALFDYLRYWLRAYREQFLRNLLDDAKVTAIHVAKVERDPYFDAITLRVFAVGCDYTLNTLGKVVTGSRTFERTYSEYWTLIRGRGVTGSRVDRESCPACGAPRSVNMAGSCDHCDSHLTFGEFDWVLSQIEQDEVYRG
ncbi:MAG: TIM44-like domain-containing protein [Nannocystaceae bacterium]